MFKVQDKYYDTYTVYSVRYEKINYDTIYTYFLIYKKCAWEWVNSRDYKPVE